MWSVLCYRQPSSKSWTKHESLSMIPPRTRLAWRSVTWNWRKRLMSTRESEYNRWGFCSSYNVLSTVHPLRCVILNMQVNTYHLNMITYSSKDYLLFLPYFITDGAVVLDIRNWSEKLYKKRYCRLLSSLTANVTFIVPNAIYAETMWPLMPIGVVMHS